MKKILLLKILICLSFIANGQGKDFIWAKNIYRGKTMNRSSVGPLDCDTIYTIATKHDLAVIVVGGVDTTSLSNRINLKLNISDTASMLSHYLRTNVAAATYSLLGHTHDSTTIAGFHTYNFYATNPFGYSTSSMTYPGAGIALSTGSAWGISITNNSSNWNTAFGWGNHASAGYLTAYSETDPIVNAINGIVKSNGSTISAASAGTDYIVPNVSITGATKIKITYDSKGLVTAGANATTADIAASTDKNYVTDAQAVVIGNTSGTNSGNQTSIVGITGTKAEYNTSCSDGNFLYVGDISQYTDENAQDAVGGILDNSGGVVFTYDDATPKITASYTETGTVSTVSVVTANGISGTVANPTTTPAMTLSIGAITPTTVNGITMSGSGSLSNSGTSALTGFTGSGTSSGTNTGDQNLSGYALVGQTMYIGTTPVAINRASAALVLTGITSIDGSAASCTGLAATATAWATARTVSITGDLAYTSGSLDGTGNVTGIGTLATVATAGTTGGSTAIPVITIDAKGRTTSITTAAVVAPAGTVTGTTLNSTVVTSSLTGIGTVTSGGLGTGAVIGGVTMTLGSDATNDMYYRNSSGVLTRFASANNAIIGTNGSGVPAMVTTIPSAVTASSLTSFGNSPAFVTPALGTPASGTMTNVSGTAANLTAGNVSTVPTTNSKTLRLDGTYGVAWAKYSFGTDGGLVSTITPGATANTTIPANAILVGGTVNVTTQVTSSGSATVAIGCAGTGGSTTTLLAATAKASLTTNALFTTVSTFAAPKKLTGAGSITFTIGTAALTAGVIEVWVEYFTAAN